MLLAIAESKTLGNLKVLTLTKNQVGDSGALALIKSPNLSQLSTLDLELNQIGRENVD